MVHQLSPPMWTVSQPHKYTNTNTKQHNPTLHIAHLLKPGILIKNSRAAVLTHLIVWQRSWSCMLVPLYSTLALTSSSDTLLEVMSCLSRTHIPSQICLFMLTPYILNKLPYRLANFLKHAHNLKYKYSCIISRLVSNLCLLEKAEKLSQILPIQINCECTHHK